MFFPRYNPVPVRPRSEILFWSAAVVMLLLFLGRNALWGMEGRTAEIVRNMLLTGDIFSFQINRVVQNSMPLGYWAVLPGTFLFGTDEFMLRLPTAFFALVLLWATGKITERLFDVQTALISRWVLLGTYGFIFWARIASPDMANAAVTACAAACFFYWKDEPDFKDYLLFYFLLGAGSLFKGIPVAAVTLALIIPCAVVRRGLGKYCSLKNLAAFCCSAVFVIIVYLICGAADNSCPGGNPAEGAVDMLWKKQIWRLLDARNLAQPFYCYIYHLPRILLPWSGIFIAGFISFFKRRRELNPEFSALLTGMIIAFILFFLSGSRSWYYLLPLVPFCSVVTAAVLAGFSGESSVMDWLLELTYFALLIFASLAFALPIAIPLQGVIFSYHIPGCAIVFSCLAGSLVIILLIFDRGEDNFISRLFSMPPRIAGMTAGIAIAVTALFCAVIPNFTVFRTEKPFVQELKKELEGIDPERIFIYSSSLHPRVLFYLSQERPVMCGKGISAFIHSNAGGRVAVIAEDDTRGMNRLKTHLAFLPQTVFDVDHPHFKERRLSHESESKDKLRAWIIDVPAAAELNK